MKSYPALAAMASALLLCLPSARILAQSKYVVIDNVGAVQGQASVNGKAAIPLDQTWQATIDPVSGDIVVRCEKGTHGGSTECSNIGSAGAGLPAAPGNPGLTLAPSGTVGAAGAKLTWNSSNASTCYGVSATPIGTGAPAVSDWVKEWPASTTSGFSLTALFNSMAPNSTAKYDFTIRCHSTATGQVGSLPVVAYVESTRQVELSKPAGGGTPQGDWCDEYLSTLDPAERDHFNMYRAENRGFTAVQKTFLEQTNKVLGVDTGLIDPEAAPVLPGKVAGAKYLALSFSVPTASQSNAGKFIINFANQTGGGISEHRIVATISPCMGDFRPRRTSLSGEHYSWGWCRSEYSKNSGLRGDTNFNVMPPVCRIPANKTMYINVSPRDLYQPGNASAPPLAPLDTCVPGNYCGASTSLQIGI